MSTIVFVKPPLKAEEMYGNLAGAGCELPPQNLCVLAAVTRQKGFSTKIVDAVALRLNYEDTIKSILRYSPNYVGITSVTMQIYSAAKLAELIKKEDDSIAIIVGGPHITAVPAETMEKFSAFDVGVIGEGEGSIIDLMLTLDSGCDLSHIDGIIFRRNGKLQVTQSHESMKDLDSLPLPAWDLLPPLAKYYSPAGDNIKKFPGSMLVTSRGCPMNCAFCCTKVMGNKIRVNSAERMIEMVKDLYYNYKIRDISFHDDNFMAFRSRLEKFCELLKKERINISWSCEGSVNFATLELLKMMKDAGCWQISWGCETGSQKILDFYRKPIKVAQVEQAISRAKKVGIHNRGFFIHGNVLETRETMEETIQLIKRLDLHDFHSCYLTIFPGTRLYDIAEKYGSWDKDWRKASLYSEPSFIPNGLTKEELKRYYKLQYKTAYLRVTTIWYFARKLFLNPRLWPKILRSFWAFLKLMFTKGFIAH